MTEYLNVPQSYLHLPLNHLSEGDRGWVAVESFVVDSGHDLFIQQNAWVWGLDTPQHRWDHGSLRIRLELEVVVIEYPLEELLSQAWKIEPMPYGRRADYLPVVKGSASHA